MKLGNIGILNATKGGWFSSAQRFFTRMSWTHSFIGVGNFLDTPSIIESDLLVEITPTKQTFEDINNIIVEFNVKIPEHIKLESIKEVYNEFAGKNSLYNFFQLPFFVYRYIAETFGFDVRKSKRNFSNRPICSEIVYVYLQKLAIKTENIELMKKLNEWNRDSVHSGDIYNICCYFSELFVLKNKE